MDNQQKYNLFRDCFPEFVYDSFEYDVQPDGLHIAFRFLALSKDSTTGKAASVDFCPTAFFPSREFLHPKRLSKDALDTLVFNIGMIELISYWKAYCPPSVVVKPFKLNDKQISFWKKLYFNGLGEFFYTNGIEASEMDFMTIRCEGKKELGIIGISELQHGVISDKPGHIVPIGGGKDSVVTLEILDDCLPLIMNPRGATRACVYKSGYGINDVIVIERTIDPCLLKVNKDASNGGLVSAGVEGGALNGHTPFSAMLAFYTLLASAMTGNRFRIALSNENSANESTVVGTKVNHQYSKSLEFENDFREYVSEFISPQFDYYSFLRPLSELQIAMLFALRPKYFHVFKSCNVGSKEDIWCGHCAKCLFAYIILSPFIEPEQLISIFGKNMLDDVSLRHEFDQLTGHAETKPFECVGTVSEVNSALTMTLERWYGQERPALLADYKPSPVTVPLDTLCIENNLPEDDFAKLESALKDKDKVEKPYRYDRLFDLLCDKEILIAGYGREGMSSYKLLHRLFPDREYDIAHNNDEIAEALRRKEYDMVLKSPGIPMFFFDGLCNPDIISSQTDIFLQVYGDHTIGVTGTKGKSTTTMVIYEGLKYDDRHHGGKDVVMAGNMGLPLFEVIPQLSESTIVVAELSCHQLEGIHRGPHVGVLLNLYQEHLDHYRSYDDYQMAKMQIGLKQCKDDVFFYCSDNKDLSGKVEGLRDQLNSEVVPYSIAANAGICSAFQNSRFKGVHNESNCIVASMVVQRFGVAESVFYAALEKCKPLEHRLEEVATVDGITYYNDSISTIPEATIEGVCALGKVDTLILGGFDRGIDYEPLVDFLYLDEKGKSIGNLVFFGSAGKRIHDACNKKNTISRREMCHFDADYSMSEAVAFAAANTAKGKICLLSPAASSYDHYKNFEFRGRHFKECVQNLITN